MSLTPGSGLGPYEVTALIGSGGMVEVYQTRHTKVNRGVAFKVLPDVFLELSSSRRSTCCSSHLLPCNSRRMMPWC